MPKVNSYRIFGINVPGDWTLTFLTRYSTGKAYTPGTTDIFEQRLLENTGTYPSTIVTDLKFNKRFHIKPLKRVLTLFVEVYDLYDRNNPQIINNWTGYPYSYGDLLGGSKRYYSHKEITILRQPLQFDQSRYVKLGIAINL